MQKRSTVVHRVRPFFPLLASIVFLVLLVLFLHTLSYPPVVYNATDSLPRGFYLVRPGVVYHKGQLVVCEVPEHVRELVVSRHWLKDDGLFIKTVVGMPGDRVMVQKGRFLVNDADYGPVYTHDTQGRRLPMYGADAYPVDGYILAAPGKQRSFDSRYFGPVAPNLILGEAIPLVLFEKYP